MQRALVIKIARFYAVNISMFLGGMGHFHIVTCTSYKKKPNKMKFNLKKNFFPQIVTYM